VAASKGVEVVTTLGPFDPEDINRRHTVGVLLGRRGHRVNEHILLCTVCKELLQGVSMV
jgi:hypothetical protein